MFDNVPTTKLVQTLELAGQILPVHLVEEILAREEESRPILLDLFRAALNDDWGPSEDPRWFRLIHAGRFMLHWREEGALPIFAKMYGDPTLSATVEYFEELPAVYGPPAVPHFVTIVQQGQGRSFDYGRVLAMTILTRIAQSHPATRPYVLVTLRNLLPKLEEIPNLTTKDVGDIGGMAAGCLADLRDEESRPTILALFEAGLMVDDFSVLEDYLRKMDKSFPTISAPTFDVKAFYRKEQEREQTRRNMLARQAEERARPAAPPPAVKVGRNDPCPCGSGKKYKKCHGQAGA